MSVYLGEGGSLSVRARHGPERALQSVHAPVELVHALGHATERPTAQVTQLHELHVVTGYVGFLDKSKSIDQSISI